MMPKGHKLASLAPSPLPLLPPPAPPRPRPAPGQVLNLVLAAGATHKWYRAHFSNYPQGRRALIPWIY